MPSPREVFDDPAKYWTFLTVPNDADFEGQNFDRKELPRGQNGQVSSSDLKEFRHDDVAETVSAFANSNKSGGLLVVGISKTGEVRGVCHLSDGQRTALANVDDLVSDSDAVVKFFDCPSVHRQNDSICLVFVPYQSSAICQTIRRPPRAWKRQGPQNFELSEMQRAQMARDKRIVEFEARLCADFSSDDLEPAVVAEFKRGRQADSQFERSDEELLYDAGATQKDAGKLAITNAGFLFFAANPQRLLPSSYIRLLRFDCSYAERENRGLPTFERPFSGPITTQIRAFRTFIQESAFFKTYQRRNAAGGFVEEPELPYIAVDEAVVNAVAHRDYVISLPITCEKYNDAFVVISPGPVLQVDDLPEAFSLDTQKLQHLPRNPRLLEWLKSMRDAQGSAFVRALSEGTRKMREAMAALELPAPSYDIADGKTTVVLYSNAIAREAALRGGPVEATSETANLYPLRFSTADKLTREQADQRRRDILLELGRKLEGDGWFIDKARFGELIAHRRKTAFAVPDAVARCLALFPAYTFQVREYFRRTYLVVDYTLTVQSTLTATEVLGMLAPERLVDMGAVAKWKGWQRGKIVEASSEWCKVFLFDYQTVEQVPTSDVIPKLPRGVIGEVLAKRGIGFDLAKEIKKQSLALQPNASRTRAEKTQAAVAHIASKVFPLSLGSVAVELVQTPTPLSVRSDDSAALRVERLAEPEVAFNRSRFSSDIREGITKFGSFDFEPHDVELVPICAPEMRDAMRALIERLRTGKFKYRGSERTFSTRLVYNSVITAPVAEIPSECARLVSERPHWVGDEKLARLFLVHSPEVGYSLDDEGSPYYLAKRTLLEAGIPCQMVDTPTLKNPDWKDLNLGLNIAAKTGTAPWVLPESIPDADFFVGLSYTQSRRGLGERMMGFANVFSNYGRWVFYSGSAEAFPYEERADHYRKLIEETLTRLPLGEDPTVCFHYSAKFSREDRNAILQAARKVRPKGRYVFVWINTDHHVRLYDSRPDGDGSVARGSFVVSGGNQLYLSTTGFNNYRKVLGTPHALEVNVHTELPEGAPYSPPDLRTLAAQVLSLTKLNWASTDSLCAEPITTKYAHDIAYLTAAFMRQGRPFRLHPVLEATPWFI